MPWGLVPCACGMPRLSRQWLYPKLPLVFHAGASCNTTVGFQSHSALQQDAPWEWRSSGHLGIVLDAPFPREES